MFESNLFDNRKQANLAPVFTFGLTLRGNQKKKKKGNQIIYHSGNHSPVCGLRKTDLFPDVVFCVLWSGDREKQTISLIEMTKTDRRHVYGADNMAQWEKIAATKPDNLSFDPQTRYAGRANSRKLFSDLHMHTHKIKT